MAASTSHTRGWLWVRAVIFVVAGVALTLLAQPLERAALSGIPDGQIRDTALLITGQLPSSAPLLLAAALAWLLPRPATGALSAAAAGKRAPGWGVLLPLAVGLAALLAASSGAVSPQWGDRADVPSIVTAALGSAARGIPAALLTAITVLVLLAPLLQRRLGAFAAGAVASLLMTAVGMVLELVSLVYSGALQVDDLGRAMTGSLLSVSLFQSLVWGAGQAILAGGLNALLRGRGVGWRLLCGTLVYAVLMAVGSRFALGGASGDFGIVAGSLSPLVLPFAVQALPSALAGLAALLVSRVRGGGSAAGSRAAVAKTPA